MAKQRFVVRMQPLAHEVVACMGPFVVYAKSERGAFRIVRNRWPHWISDHVCRINRVLESNGIMYDRRGQLLAR